MWSEQVLANDAYTSACRTKGVNCPPTNGPDFDFGSSAILVRAPNGKEILVAGQKSGMVYAFDPDAKGKILWQTRVGKGGLNGGVQWGMASDEQKVYAAVNDTSGVMNTAGPVGGATFDPAKGGGLTALHLEDGSKAWFAPSHPCDPPRPGCSPGQSAALTLIPGVVFSASLDGHVRAFSTEDGEMLWDFDTRTDLFHGERSAGQRRLDRRRGPGHCRRHDVRQLRISSQRRHAGQRVAGVWAGGLK